MAITLKIAKNVKDNDNKLAILLLFRLNVRPPVRNKFVRLSQVKLLVGFQQNYKGVISTIPS
jgi:hypothetical protein